MTAFSVRYSSAREGRSSRCPHTKAPPSTKCTTSSPPLNHFKHKHIADQLKLWMIAQVEPPHNKHDVLLLPLLFPGQFCFITPRDLFMLEQKLIILKSSLHFK
ncbi:Hypothetical protein, putative [Bodo saltans]|uniref:Uncharacterized protein n=1 Tax=Bodo saltans TaxID=75058 RepID=A0A0S4J8H2_BODSA|nr:Hypothetical protein, putative [Bodo saltans]|eukprot:CUG86234.1 Hypothetical protein, putative [Bodo saltans]